MRIVRGKEHHVKAHFRHHKAESEQAKACEARAVSKEGRAYIQKFSVEAKGQRIYLWDRRMWEMICDKKDVPKKLDRALSIRLSEELLEGVPQIIRTLHNHWSDDRAGISKYLREVIKSLSLETASSALGSGVIPQNPETEELFAVWRDNLINAAQYAIAEEVIDYLGQATNGKCFANLIKLSILDANEFCKAQKHEFTVNVVRQMAIALIALTEWVVHAPSWMLRDI